MRVGVALGLTMLAVLAGVVALLSAERPRLAGTNNVFDAFPNVELDAGQEACAVGEVIPGDAAAVRVHATGERGGGALTVRLVRERRELARGSLGAGWSDGQIDVPIRPVVASTQADVDVCFRNGGSTRIALWGYGDAGEPRTLRDGEPLSERVRLSYVRPGSESAWDLLGAVARRMGVGRGEWLDGWPFYGWLAAVAGVLAVMFFAVGRAPRT